MMMVSNAVPRSHSGRLDPPDDAPDVEEGGVAVDSDASGRCEDEEPESIDEWAPTKCADLLQTTGERTGSGGVEQTLPDYGSIGVLEQQVRLKRLLAA